MYGTLNARFPLGLNLTEIFLVLLYLMREILREPLHVLRRKRISDTSLSRYHRHDEKFLRVCDGNILAKLLGYFVDVHTGIISQEQAKFPHREKCMIWYSLYMKRRALKRGRNIVSLPVLIERDEDGMYVGTVPTLRSCYTQGKTLEELYGNLREAVALSLEVEKDFFKGRIVPSTIVGFQTLEFAT